MKIKTVCALTVLDKVAKEFDFPIKDDSGKEIGRNKGMTYQICVKPEGDLPQNIKLSKDISSKFDDIVIGQSNNFVFEFETNPRAYIGKDNKANINFADIPQIIDIVPFKK